MSPEDRKRDRYYRKTYNIGLCDYNQMLKEQNDSCGICSKHRLQFNRALHVDHDHRFDRVKLKLTKKPDRRWVALGVVGSWTALGEGDTKAEARKHARLNFKGLSIRGLLCWGCNAAIQKFRDSADKMEAAARYIRKFNSRMGL